MSKPKKGQRPDVIIIGAGVAGSSLARVLAGSGWDVLLVERDQLPRHKVCGEFLSPESQASLRAMDLDRVVSALSPAPMDRAALISRRGVTIQLPLPGTAWGVSRFELDNALAQAAREAGVDVQTGVTATAIDRTDREFRVTLRSKQGPAIIESRMVVAACGRYSLPALPPRGGRQSERRTYVGLKRHYQDITMPARVELYLFPGGYAGAAPIEGNRVNVCLLVTQAAFRRGGKSTGSMLEAAARWNPVLGRRLQTGRALPETEAAVAPVDPYRPAAAWDGVACLGDTAVMIPPLSGDGMAMALRSAELCAPLAHDFLRGRLSLFGWRTSYCRAWHKEFKTRIRAGRYLQTVLESPALSEIGVALGKLLPPLAALLVRTTRGRLRPEAGPALLAGSYLLKK